MSVIIMMMIMIRSSPRSPPLLSPHPARWTGDLVLKTSTITSLYQGITNMMIVMMMVMMAMIMMTMMMMVMMMMMMTTIADKGPPV